MGFSHRQYKEYVFFFRGKLSKKGIRMFLKSKNLHIITTFFFADYKNEYFCK